MAAASELPPWLKPHGEGLVLLLHVQPRAKKNLVVGPTAEGLLKIKLAAPPVEGKANQELIRFIAQRLGLPQNRLEISGGEKSPRKRVAVAGMEAADCVRRLTS